jgi:hypothetical protein
MKTDTLFNPENLWKKIPSYYGRDWDGYASIMGRNRDSGCVDNSNWEEACRLLNPWIGEEGSGVEINRCSHWACGWTEEIMISPEAPDRAKEIAQKILTRIADYPILNEDLYNQKQSDHAIETWEAILERDRIEVLTRFGFEDPQSLADQDHPPLDQDHDGRLWEYLTSDSN